MDFEPSNKPRDEIEMPPALPTYARPPRTTPQTADKTTVEVMTGGASLEAIGGAGAIVLSIIGLTAYMPLYMSAIATILVGAGMLVHGVSVAARWRDTIERFRTDESQQITVSGGVGTETLGGAGGVVLGILALAGILPLVLLPIAAIVLGASVLLAGPAQPELGQLAATTDPQFTRAATAAARSAGGVDVLVGGGAVVLGILTLVHIGPPLAMTLVAMLALGGALFLSGGALAARFGKSLKQSSFSKEQSHGY